MIRKFSVNFAIFSTFLDAGLVIGSLKIAEHLRPYFNDTGFIKDLGMDAYVPWWVYLAFVTIWIGIFLASSIYDGKKNLELYEELTALTSASLLSVVASAGVLYLSYRDLSRFLFIFFALLAVILLVTWRLIYRWLLNREKLRISERKVLVVGTGEIGQTLKEQIMNKTSLGLSFVGYVSNVRTEDVIGHYDEIRQLVNKFSIDDVIIGLTNGEANRINQLVNDLYDLPIHVWVAPDFLSLALHKAKFEEFAGISMFDLRAPAISDYQRMLKRGFDLFLAIIILPFVLVLMGFISLLIIVFDSGPVFFSQERQGENGKVFKMHKFRTMVVGADKYRKKLEKELPAGKKNYKHKNDSRVTPIGRILRKTSLDELPQIINILKGEMSFVGPRPELPDLVAEYEIWQRARFAVPPGITGWWQINGRSDRPMHLYTEDDIYYINNYSLWLDFKILLRTVWVVLIGRGAY